MHVHVYHIVSVKVCAVYICMHSFFPNNSYNRSIVVITGGFKVYCT